MGDALGPQTPSQVPTVCPVCHQVHERCEFRAGSVYCVRPDCQNPHHREPRPGSYAPRHEQRPPADRRGEAGQTRGASRPATVARQRCRLPGQAGTMRTALRPRGRAGPPGGHVMAPGRGRLPGAPPRGVPRRNPGRYPDALRSCALLPWPLSRPAAGNNPGRDAPPRAPRRGTLVGARVRRNHAREGSPAEEVTWPSADEPWRTSGAHEARIFPRRPVPSGTVRAG
jgi:hypothetical protein